MFKKVLFIFAITVLGVVSGISAPKNIYANNNVSNNVVQEGSNIVTRKFKVTVNATTQEITLNFDLQDSKEMFKQINDIRKANGVKPLIWNNGLEKAAQIRGIEIISKYSHERPNGSQWYTVDEKNLFAENLGIKFKTASEMVNSWMESSTHRANVLDSNMVSTNIAVFNYDGVNYAVHTFSVYDSYQK